MHCIKVANHLCIQHWSYGEVSSCRVVGPPLLDAEKLEGAGSSIEMAGAQEEVSYLRSRPVKEWFVNDRGEREGRK